MTAAAKNRLTWTLLGVQLAGAALCFIAYFQHIAWLQWAGVGVFATALLARYAVRFLVPVDAGDHDPESR